MKIREVTKEIFEAAVAVSDKKNDSFARTFLCKSNMLNLWEDCWGIFEGDELCCAIIVTISKREPKIANLQLIHTFYKFRNKGYAKLLTNVVIEDIRDEIKYFRVSAEKTAIGFYKKLGFKFLGEQKSGTQLSMCLVTSKNISECSFDLNDPVINKGVYRKGKGGCVKIF